MSKYPDFGSWIGSLGEPFLPSTPDPGESTLPSPSVLPGLLGSRHRKGDPLPVSSEQFTAPEDFNVVRGVCDPMSESLLMHEQSSGLESTGRMEEAQRTRELFSDIRSEESSEAWPEADLGVEDPDMQSHTLQLEQSDAGSHARTVFQQGGVGEEPEAIDPYSDCVHTERNKQESYAFLQEQETAELQNDSPHSEGSKSELMVLPLGEAGAEKGDPATGSYSLNVFRKEVEEEREDADPQSSSREGNESNLKIVPEQEGIDPPSHPSHSESEENLCVTHATTDPPSVVSHVSISDSSAQKLSGNRSPVPPGTKLGIISKVSSFFQRLKSLRGTQEKERASPVIVQAAKFKNAGPSHYAIPGYGDNR